MMPDREANGPAEPQAERIGRYEIIGELGHGAMGVVYKARDPHLDRIVAIKALRIDPGLPPDQLAELERRFSQEAIAAGRLNHPNIVAVHDVVEIDRISYIVMECVDGRTLASLIASGELRLPDAVGLVLQVCSALEYAHARGVVHRDIKPGNILVTEAGQVKVSDFGIARVSGRNVTQTGAMLGTPAYMSPEQVCGRDVDGRSDLFSLGLVLYEAIAGRDAFRADNATAVMYQIVHEEPIPIRELVPSVPPALDQAIRRALAKQPGQRYATAGAFADALRSTLDAADDRATIVMPGPGPVKGHPSRMRRPAVLLSAAASVLIVAAVGTVLWTQRPAVVSPTPQTSGPLPSADPRVASATSEAAPQPARDTSSVDATSQRRAEPESAPPAAPAESESTKTTVREAPSRSTTGSSTSRGAAAPETERAGQAVAPAARAGGSPSAPPAGPAPRAQEVTARGERPAPRAQEVTARTERPAPPAAGSGGSPSAPPAGPAPRAQEAMARTERPAPPAAGSGGSPSAPPAVPAPRAREASTPVERQAASLAPSDARPASPTPDEVRTQIVSLLRGSDKLSGVKVEVTSRFVAHLSGRVWDEEAQQLAVKLAGSVRGVTEVTQAIVVAKREMNEKFREAVQGGTIRRTP